MAPMVHETSPLVFTVHRKNPELVAPAKPTPRDYKALSDIDDQESLRFHPTFVQIYAGQVSMQGKDPAGVIRAALAQALVYYYPFAGRLREGPDNKLWVDCTGDGVLFIEADADVTLQQLHDHDSLRPPFPCFDQLLFDVAGSLEILHSPLLLVQVTKLKHGGFFFAIRFNHTITDGQGLTQFLQAVAELARGAGEPTILPVWKRHLLNSRHPPRVTRAHPEYDDLKPAATGTNDPAEQMIDRSFFFGPVQLSVLRNLVPVHLRRCSKYDLLTALIWRCRTAALQPDPEQEVRMCCVVSSRGGPNSPLPPQFYGNSFSIPAAVSTAGKLLGNSLAYAVELVLEAKARANEDAAEHIQSAADLMVLKGRRGTHFMRGGWSYMVSDITRLGLDGVDYGWGKAVYGGVGKAVRQVPGGALSAVKNREGVEGVAFVIPLPPKVMDRFQQELRKMIKDNYSISSSL